MVFDEKNFNGEVFAAYVEKTPNLNRNELIKSKAIRRNQEIASKFADQVGGNYATVPIFGRIGGTPDNYDGSTNITSDSSTTYTQGRIVVGRAHSWTENDFSYDITGGVGFLEQTAAQIGEYWDEVDQATLLATLAGVFNMTGTENLKFVNGHTYDISGNTGAAAEFNATTLNKGMQKSLGDNKAKFTLAFMHSSVATNLENIKLLDYLKYTDKDGIQRNLAIGTLNGRTVLVDDGMPAEEIPAVYEASTDTEVVSGKTYYTRSGSSGNYTYTPVASPTGNPSTSSYYEKTADAYMKYTTYVLGDGAIEYTDCGVFKPYEMDRDPKTNGGRTTLYSRQRKIFSPYGISFTDSTIISPTDAQLATGSKWALASSNAQSNAKYFPHKAIPIARIISRG